MIKYIENFFDATNFQTTAEEVKEQVKKTVNNLFNKNINLYNYTWSYPFIFTIHEGEYHPVHSDFSDKDSRPDISCILYLSDDFEGGEIYFPEFDIEIKPSMNSLIIFNSNSLHGVKHVTKGERHAVSLFWNFIKD